MMQLQTENRLRFEASDDRRAQLSPKCSPEGSVGVQAAFSSTGEGLARLRSELAVWRQRSMRLAAL